MFGDFDNKLKWEHGKNSVFLFGDQDLGVLYRLGRFL